MVDLYKSNRREESTLVNIWMWEKHRDALQWRRVRLGTMPTHELGRIFQVTLRWADAIFYEDGVVYIVEAKVKADAGAVGQLKLYKQEFVRTPEFQEFWNRPLKLILLSKKFDTALAELCIKENIIYVVYTDEDLQKSILVSTPA